MCVNDTMRTTVTWPTGMAAHVAAAIALALLARVAPKQRYVPVMLGGPRVPPCEPDDPGRRRTAPPYVCAGHALEADDKPCCGAASLADRLRPSRLAEPSVVAGVNPAPLTPGCLASRVSAAAEDVAESAIGGPEEASPAGRAVTSGSHFPAGQDQDDPLRFVRTPRHW